MKSIATFALGCFWGPDEFFSKIPGISETTVGYTGGTLEDPTYENLGDHTEAIQIEFDPAAISYEDLLEYFWEQHNPTLKHKTQYKSAIFYEDDEQKEIAEKAKKSRQRKTSGMIATEIINGGTFYPAEDYHQKYLQKNRGAAC
jgi:peptide-methionine (S)-S-oxide reductase